MLYRHILFFLLLISDVYRIWKKILTASQQKKSLPKEVRDIYTPEKYQEFLMRERDYMPLWILSLCIHIVFNAFVIYSPFYRWMETLGKGSPYRIMIATVLCDALIEFVLRLPRAYYSAFVIEEKYHLNKMSRKEFFKDEFIGLGTELFADFAVYGLLMFVCLHISEWTGNFQISYLQSFAITALLALIGTAAVFAISIIVYFLQRMQYTYTDLPEGELRDKIIALTSGTKRKIRRIEVYSESKKSTRKNAYMLKILWYRAFGIADNYLDENSERELLSVLAHEAGHLKHKNDLLDYLRFIPLPVILILLTLFLPNAGMVRSMADGINHSFGLSADNYILLFTFVSAFLSPLIFTFGVFANYVSRRNETEADLNAVKEGYGKELADTFRQMGSDELIDVNPAPLIVFLEHDHPAIVNRIRTIESAMTRP